MPRVAGRGPAGRPRQLESGHDHDRPRGGRCRVPRAAHGRVARADHRPRAPGCAPADPRRSDGPEFGRRTGRGRRDRKIRRRAARHAAGHHQAGRRPRTLQSQNDRDRRAGSLECDRHRRRERRRLRERPELPAHRAPGLHAGRHRRRPRALRSGAARDPRDRARGEHHPPSAGRNVALGLERDRVRSPARPREQLHHRLQHGKYRPGRGPYRRLGGRGAVADPLGPRLSDAAHGEHQRDPRAQRPGRLQHPVRAAPRPQRIPNHRGQSARVAQLRAGVQSHRLSDREDLDQDRAGPNARRDP